MSNHLVETTLRPTIPGRRDTTLLALSQLVIAIFAVLLKPALLGYGIAALCFSAGAIFLSGLLFPHRFIKGVRVSASGFELWRPLRNPLSIPYAEIEKIVAVCHGEGDTSDELTFVVHTKSAQASVEEVDLHSTELFRNLSSLPGFLQSEFQRAASHNATFIETVVGKRFTIFEKQRVGQANA